MTRFARAKGSKASNERLPNEATPWHVMKQQLSESLDKSQETQDKTKSAKELLEEKEDLFYQDTEGNKSNSEWAEFEESKPKKKKTESKKQKSKKEQKEKKKHQKLEDASQIAGNTEESQSQQCTNKKKNLKRKSENDSDNQSVKVKKKKSLKQENDFVESENAEHNESDNSNKKQLDQDLKIKKSKKDGKPKHKNKKLKANEITESNDHTENNEEKDTKQVLSKRQKRNMKAKLKNEQNESSNNFQAFTAEGNDWNNRIKFGKKKQRREDTQEPSGEDVTSENNTQDQQTETSKGPFNKFSRDQFKRPDGFNKYPNKFNNNKFGQPFNKNMNNRNRKPPKIRDDKEHKRRKPDLGPMKMTINGVDIEIVKYDGFPVKKEDAERLKDLKQQMIMKGIPKAEIDAAMKLERRRAEKALAHMRKNVCFHCRKSGHNLSDCPELEKEQGGTGICFKCGSTEHTHFECKVTKAAEYRYATCFICREQGHIAKQCPDNPKGVYPQGGACKVCGDVTHLKKDCPELAKQKEESAVTVDKIDDGTLESLESTKKSTEKDKETSAKRKIVTF